MSFSDGNFGGRVIGATGPLVVQFATINDLITASQGSLTPGYYEVPGEWITHWNGAVFSPGVPVPSQTIGNSLPSDDGAIKPVEFYAYPADNGTALVHDLATYADDLESGSAWSFV